MKVKELVELILEEISIYEVISYDEFETIYVGEPENIPNDILKMKIKTVGVTDGRVDIQV